MSDLKVLVPLMRGMVKELQESEQKINSQLVDIKKGKLNLSEYIRTIEQQIKTANNKFTLSFVGEFKSGKSTIINTLLELSDDQKLSHETNPDTAQCIRLMYKMDDMDYDAEIVFQPGTFENEKTTWKDAKRYTSQVALDQDESISAKAEKIEEVRYYIKNQFLETCNILDLPGTGAGGHSHDHTMVTNKKIMESDVIFWVVTTADEPGKEAIRNLDKFKDKVIPVINVWQHEKEEIYGNCTLEETEQLLKDKYSVYFSDDVQMISYYAKEIEYAMDNGFEIDPTWGKSEFAEKLNMIFSSDNFNREMGTMNRIKRNLSNSMQKVSKAIDESKIEITEVIKDTEEEKTEIDLSVMRLDKIKNTALIQVLDICKSSTNEIIEFLTAQTDCFIEDEMQLTNLRMMIRSIKKENKETIKNEMIKKYKTQYLQLNETPSWHDELRKDLMENIQTVLNSEYATFAVQANKQSNFNGELKISGEIIDGIIAQSTSAMIEKLGNLLITGLSAVVLAIVPGGALVDSIAISLLGGSKLNTDTITQKKESIKNRSRLQISLQRYAVGNELKDVGRNLNDDVYSRIKANVTQRIVDKELYKQKCHDIGKSFEDLHESIGNYNEQITKF